MSFSSASASCAVVTSTAHPLVVAPDGRGAEPVAVPL